jgi:serine/threonine-protein kinase
MAVTETRVLNGRYILHEVLGTGGMATVWLAHDQVLGREVAVKVLSQQYAAEPGFLGRFGREARHAASVSSPRLVTVFDSGVDQGMPFLVMELVAGQTLEQVLDEAGPLSPGEAAGIAVAVCEGLEAAHTAGLVHRDIKPANIMLADGQVKILDFGIARAEGTTAGTAAGMVLGTPAYLSPEQAAGHPAGRASDLYALGCVLFEMLTGTPPFTGESPVALIYRQVHDDPGPPSARRPGLPAGLDQVTAWLLAKDPAARPASAAAARVALLAASAPGSPAVPVSPAGFSTGGRRPRRSEAILAAALAAALIALVTVLLARPGSGVSHAAGRSPAAPAMTGHAPSTTPTPNPTHPTPAARSTPGEARTAPPTPSPTRPTQAAGSTPVAAHTTPALPPVASAAAALVGDLQAGVADGQVTQQAGQDLFSHLQPLLFPPPGQNPQQVRDQFTQFTKTYDQHQSQGQITGKAAAVLPGAITALGTALGIS